MKNGWENQANQVTMNLELERKKKKLFSFSTEKRKAAEESVFFRRHLSLLLLCT